MKKVGLILIGLLCVCGMQAQSEDLHLGRALQYISKGDFARADQEIVQVRHWGCEEEHRYKVTSMQQAYAYLQYSLTSNAPQAAKDSIALYMVEDCGNQANELSDRGDKRGFKAICLLGLKMCEISMAKRHQDYAVLLIDMSVYCHMQNDIDQALDYSLQALQVYTDNNLPKNDTYCLIAFLTGGYYAMLDNMVDAYPYIRMAYEASERLGAQSVYYDRILDYFAKLEGMLGLHYSNQSQFDESIRHYLNGMALREKASGQNEQYAAFLGNLATAYQRKGDFQTAKRYCQQSLELHKELYGEWHYQYALALNNFGTLYMEMGDDERALHYLLQARRVLAQLGEHNGLYATVLGSLGTIYRDRGDLKKAEDYLSRALSMHAEVNGTTSEDYANALNNIAAYYYQVGDLSKARQYYEQALSLYESLYGADHPDCATVLSNLGLVYDDLNEYAKAEQCFLRSLNIRRAVLGPKHIDCATTLNNLGLHYDQLGDIRTALKYVLEAWEIKKAVYGEDNVSAAISLSNIATLYQELGDYQRAGTYLEKVYAIVRRNYAESHPLFITTVSNVGYNYYLMGDYRRAEPYLMKSYTLQKQRFIASMEFMTESERAHFMRDMEYEFAYAIPNFTYDYYAQEPRYAGIAYDNQLFYKGALLQSAEAVRRSVLESGDAALIRQWTALKELHEQILQLQESDPTSTQLAEYEQRAEQMEKSLIQSSAMYRENKEQWNTSWEDVRNALQPRQVAIEFSSVLRDSGDKLCCALLLRSDSRYPQLIPLFEENEMSVWLQHYTTDALYDYTQQGQQLYGKIWSKLLPYLHYGDTVYCAATGVLHQIAIESLPYNAEQTIGSLFQIERVSSTRELVHAHRAERPQSAVLYGGIYYDLEIDDLLAQSESYSDMQFASTRAVTDESLRAGVHYLPGTRYEVEMIRAMLSPSAIDTRVYTTSAANEESFKALSGQKKNILHIATHGFYWSDSTAREQRYFAQRSARTGTSSATIDPLTRSGLLFAGSNIALRGHSDELPQSVQDGILTSKEISLLDLRGSEMVVLSACETGRGEITGDGVFGLQRAFKMAGAQTILMSLWPVDDAATQLMMTEFYYYWIEKKMTKREAFLKAQASVKQQYTQPTYWAAFILLD